MNATAMFSLPSGFEDLIGELAAAKAKPVKVKVRVGILAPHEAALKAGEAIPALLFQSVANYSYNTRAKALLALYEAGDLPGIVGFEVKGVNTYARALSRYRDILAKSLQDRAEAAKPAAVATPKIAKPKAKAKKITAAKIAA